MKLTLSTNEVTLIGFVGGDAQAKETKNHNKYAVVSLATTESWKDKNGDWQKRSTWHRLVGWQAVGESMIRNLSRGAFIQVTLDATSETSFSGVPRSSPRSCFRLRSCGHCCA